MRHTRWIAFLIALLAAPILPARQITVTLLATTDLHGNLYPVDYFTAQPADRGLAKIANLDRTAGCSMSPAAPGDNGEAPKAAPPTAGSQR